MNCTFHLKRAALSFRMSFVLPPMKEVKDLGVALYTAEVPGNISLSVLFRSDHLEIQS